MESITNDLNPTWALRFLRAPELWRKGLTGKGVAVGHLDTGVTGDHPALANRVAAFARFNDREREEKDIPVDDEHHGTHTAGLICGGVVDGWNIGVAPEARLHAAAVLDGGNNLVRALLGMDWLLGSGIRVLCFSMGVPGYNPVFYTMLKALRAQGVLPVCPIGNGGVDSFHAPGIYPNVLGVGAVNQHGIVAQLSGCFRDGRNGPCRKPEILAPGVKIVSAYASGDLRRRAESGTSQACALVAGAAALLFQAKPDATPGEVEQALLASCEPLHGADARRSQFGIVNPLRAVELLLADAPSEKALQRQTISLPHKHTDAVLRKMCLHGPSNTSVASIIVAADGVPYNDERGPVGMVIDRLQAELGESVEKVRYIPCARLAILHASRGFTWKLALDEDVIVASACHARDDSSSLYGAF